MRVGYASLSKTDRFMKYTLYGFDIGTKYVQTSDCIRASHKDYIANVLLQQQTNFRACEENGSVYKDGH